ncbi:glycosyltransferase, partial [Klebsiella pneumoniae]|uniref:glycosyltransferase n=1 Tax=Klebsiella pneumoniae TaxID=573 RepID=UPI0023B01377
MYCTDQGNDLVKDREGFAEVSAKLGTLLTYIQQSNLGGSGGFSRGMYETVKAGSSDYILLLDDDAVSEPESILRAIQFADYTIRPLLVG